MTTTSTAAMLDGRVDEPKGDPGNTLSRDEIDAKARRLAALRQKPRRSATSTG